MSNGRETSAGRENTGFELELSETTLKNKENDFPKLEDVDDHHKDNKDNRCGFGSFSPDWIQSLSTKRNFLAVFSLLGVIQAMSNSYFTATISTLEKRFKISSQTMGIVMTGNETSQILLSLIISYYGAKGHRPRLIAVGVFLSGLACFVLATPHFIFGSGDEALSLTNEYFHPRDSNSSLQGRNLTSMFGVKKGKVTICKRGGNRGEDSCEIEVLRWAPLILIFMSQFVTGIGVLLFYTLGGPYLDDNTKRTNMPMIFGVTMSLRLIGPAMGYFIASRTLKLYINPLLTPYITPEDPRWIGAWWLGWVVFGTLMTFASFFISLFPRKLTKKGDNEIDSEVEPQGPTTIPKLSDIPKAVKLLVKNKLNIFNNMAGVFYLFAGIGYSTYVPKYMETIFMQTASNASVISGAVGISFQALGIFLSGILISRFQFHARTLAAWNVMTALGLVLVKIAFTQMGCDVGIPAFGTEQSDGTWDLNASCNQDCHCKTSKILPICHKEENTVYYSACHAGCTTYENNTIGNCSCISANNPTVVLGNCAEGCGQIFTIFLIITATIKFLDSSGRIGNILISYRCVSLEERSLSLGLHMLLVSALAFFPSPIIIGTIIDSVCLVWAGSGCGYQGNRGNCMLYNGPQLRYVFNLTTGFFTLIGAVLDCVVWYLCKDLDLYKEPEKYKDDELQRKKSIVGL